MHITSFRLSGCKCKGQKPVSSMINVIVYQDICHDDCFGQQIKIIGKNLTSIEIA